MVHVCEPSVVEPTTTSTDAAERTCAESRMNVFVHDNVASVHVASVHQLRPARPDRRPRSPLASSSIVASVVMCDVALPFISSVPRDPTADPGPRSPPAVLYRI